MTGKKTLRDILKEATNSVSDFIAATEDDVSKFVAKMVEQGEITKEEGLKLVKDFLKNIKHDQEEIENRVNREIKATLDHLVIPDQGEVDKLKQRLEYLEDDIARLEKRLEAASA